MQLKEGYKQTEIGVLPEDWDTPELGGLGSFKNGVNKDKESFGFGFPFVNLMDVFGKSILDERVELELLDSNSIEHELYGLKRGDVLFVRSSVKPSGVGLTCLIPNNLKKTVFSGFLIRYRENQKINLDFKRYCFYEERFRQRIIASSTVSANTNINQEVLKKIRVALPPTLEEQQAIATALSEVDALITKIDKLITKKKTIKQGTMQQLLKSPAQGGKRLAGFDGEWVEKELGEVLQVIGGGAFKSVDASTSGIRWLKIANVGINKVSWNEESYLPESLITENRQFLLQEGDYVVALTRPILRKELKITQLKKEDTPALLNQRVGKLEAISGNDIDFIYFLLQKEQVIESLLQSMAGTDPPNLSNQGIYTIKCIVSTCHNEQKAIALVLLDMDKDLKNLEKKKSKYIRIKQGMMQELLTGKTRLI